MDVWVKLWWSLTVCWSDYVGIPVWVFWWAWTRVYARCVLNCRMLLLLFSVDVPWNHVFFKVCTTFINYVSVKLKKTFPKKKKPTNHKWYGALPSSPITFGIRASMQMLARGQLRVPSPQSCPCLSQLWSWLPITTGWLSSKPCFFQPPVLGLQAHATMASMFGGSSSGPHAYVPSTWLMEPSPQPLASSPPSTRSVCVLSAPRPPLCVLALRMVSWLPPTPSLTLPCVHFSLHSVVSCFVHITTLQRLFVHLSAFLLVSEGRDWLVCLFICIFFISRTWYSACHKLFAKSINWVFSSKEWKNS